MTMENVQPAERGPQPAGDEPALDTKANVAEAGVAAVAEAEAAAGSEAAQLAEEVGDRGAAAYAAASSDTAQAFEEARGRLQQIGMPGLDASKAVFDRLKQNSDHVSARAFEGYGRTAQAMAEFNAKAIEAWRINAEAAIAHWKSLAGVTNWSEMIALNTAHARKQIEAVTAQTRELAQLARDGADRVKLQG